MSVAIKKVTTKKELKLFAEYPNKLYKGNPFYVPTLASEDLKTFDRKKNAAYEFCDADFFLAYRNGTVVGRIAAILNPRANEAWKENTARFGWIDFVDDELVSSALLHTVEEWAKERGMTSIQGPLGFSDFDTEGMLVEGFDRLGTMVTFYNHPYYMQHLEKLGYTKKIDWLERRLTIPEKLPEKFTRYASLVAERNNLRAVHYTKKEIFAKGIGYKLFDLVNHTYCVLFGYSQLSEKQMEQYVDSYISLLNLDYVSFIVDENENLKAFGVMLPSMSQALQKANGKYLPFGWFHLLRAIKGKGSDTIDMLLVAVEPDLQSKGVPALIISDLFHRVIAGGFKYAETNPELENNHAIQNLWSAFESEQHKRRRVYGKEL